MMLKGKIALVTGASRGIGQAISLALGKAGAIVYGTATSESGAQAITSALRMAGLQGQGLVLNVTDKSSIEALEKFLKDANQLPEILVNNAGITRDKLLLAMKDDDWDVVIATNLTSVYRLSKLFMRPMLKAQWGRIINISSMGGVSGNAGQSNYAAAKAGVIGFSKSLAKEIGSRNITVNVVAPGYILTDMTQDLLESLNKDIIPHIPLGKVGAVEDIANMVVYLASDEAKYITGQTMHVNGGLLMV
jgi:3-oxoacyl-[acyl-carrier protein] reductase